MLDRGVIVVFTVLFAFVTVFFLTNKRYKSTNHPVLDVIRANFSKLNPKYADIPLREGDSAFTENKEMITLCLADPETGRYYDINTLMYVAIHELAHVVSDTEGHEDEFKKNFANLLKEAQNLKIYDPLKPIPATYCKVKTS